MKTKECENASVAGTDRPARKRRGRGKAARIGATTGWDAIETLVGTVPGPEDWAAEHDHYLRGTPKRNTGQR